MAKRKSSKKRKLFYRTPEGKALVATLDTLEGQAFLNSAGPGPDGLDYAGETEVDWDSQEPQTSTLGGRRFVDEDQRIWNEADLVLVDSRGRKVGKPEKPALVDAVVCNLRSLSGFPDLKVEEVERVVNRLNFINGGRENMKRLDVMKWLASRDSRPSDINTESRAMMVAALLFMLDRDARIRAELEGIIHTATHTEEPRIKRVAFYASECANHMLKRFYNGQ